ncbi:MAG: acyltransferase family protein, partial [Armatimonadetes bacterium]|nr:acyltransferase family protein [Armatimonadota bacterium]
MSDPNGNKQGGVVSTRVRDATFDIVKGISILEVMLHHLLSFSASRFSRVGSSVWWAMMMAHKVLHFAVPTFLLLSALLLAKSLRRTEQPDWKRFFKRRAERSLLPYLLWTTIYLGFRLRFVHVLREVQGVHLSLAGRTITVPALLLDATEWRA